MRKGYWADCACRKHGAVSRPIVVLGLEVREARLGERTRKRKGEWEVDTDG